MASKGNFLFVAAFLGLKIGLRRRETKMYLYNCDVLYVCASFFNVLPHLNIEMFFLKKKVKCIHVELNIAKNM